MEPVCGWMTRGIRERLEVEVFIGDQFTELLRKLFCGNLCSRFCWAKFRGLFWFQYFPRGALDDFLLQFLFAIVAARLHPDRFVVMGRLDTEDPGVKEQLPTWTSQPGMKGVRLTFHTPWQLPLLTEGKVEWFWPLAERYGIRVTLLAPHRLLYLIDSIAERHPNLRISLDHMAIPYHTKDEASFSGLDKLLELAPRSNIAVKLSGLPCNISEQYPFPGLHGHIRQRFLAAAVQLPAISYTFYRGAAVAHRR